jgi:hypothetical protein
VAPSKIDLSVNLTEGAANLVFSTSPRLEILRSTGTGVLLMKVGLAATSKRILVANSSGVRTHTLPVHTTSASVAVETGDIVYLDISVAGNYTKMMRGTRTKVTWTPYVALPRVYDVAYGSVPGTYAVAALGFTGAVDRTPYEFYGTLPADVQSTNVNPDSLVTVQGVDVPTPEYALIRCRAVGEYPPVMPAIGWYAGQTFTGQVKFNFYALRKRQASHGEMDVWFSTDSAFPEYLLAQPYRALKRDARSYRADHLSTDANRSVYQASTSLDGAALPNVYVAPSDGQVISSKADTAQIVRESKVFNKLRVDAGISQNVVD